MTTTKGDGVAVLAFGMAQSEYRHADRYGQYFWVIELADGREMQLNADRMEVGPSGALLAWGDRYRTSRDVDPPTYEDRAAPALLMALAPGSWRCSYAASCLDSAPVCVDYLAEPEVGA